MTNQLEVLVNMQVVLCKAWASMMTDGFGAYQRLLDHQIKLFTQHPSYIRLQDIIPQGPDLKDHYGKRAHDVDVERV